MSEQPGDVVAETRLILVVKPGELKLANTLLNAIDKTSTGDIISVGLRRTGNAGFTPDAFWSSWAMPNETRGKVFNVLVNHPRLGGGVIDRDDPVPAWSERDFWVFDGDQFAYSEVLSVLGLETIPTQER